jgi:hypothetical protein
MDEKNQKFIQICVEKHLISNHRWEVNVKMQFTEGCGLDSFCSEKGPVAERLSC